MSENKKRLLGKEDAVEIIQTLYQNYVDKYHKVPKVLIAVGGTAMALHDMRPFSEDVDIYAAEDAFLPFVEQLESATKMRIDVTGKTTLWGELDIQDIESDAQVKSKVDISLDGHVFQVDIAAISPETLFIIKASTLREKDRDDLPMILEKTTPEKIFKRAETLLRKTDKWLASDVLENIFSEMELVTFEVSQPDWLEDCDYLIANFDEVLSNHGIHIETKNKDHYQQGEF